MLRKPFALVALVFLASFCGLAFANELPVETPLDRIYGPYAPIVRGVFQGLLQLGMIALVALPLQWLLPATRRRPKILSYEFWLDFLFWAQSIWLSLVSFYVLVEWLTQAVYGPGGAWLPWLAQLPSWAQVLIAVWAFDFLVYWRHRWEHTFTALWSFHAVHHTAEQVDFLTTTRLHPLEGALGALFNAAAVRLGLDPAAAALGFAIYLNYNYFIHTNVRVRYPGFLKYVLVSPFMHHWHHALDDKAMGKNVGVVFAWNDWLFGTAYHPEHWPTKFGLAAPPGERVGQSYVRLLLYPLQLLIARTAAWRLARAQSRA